MNILYIDHGGRVADSYIYQYYGDLYRELKEISNVHLYEGQVRDIRPLLQNASVNYDCIMFGLGYFAQRDPLSYREIAGLKESNIPVVCLFHKPQVMIKDKLYFCKVNDIDLLVDSQITYKSFGQLLQTDSIRIWFSATPKHYHPRDVGKEYDVGFSGASHGNGKIQGPTADLRDRVHSALTNKDYKLFWNRQTKPSDRISSVVLRNINVFILFRLL